MRGVVVPTLYIVGDWTEGLARANAFISAVEAGLPHYLASTSYFTRGLIRLARGESALAVADCEEALKFATRAADPQQMLPAQGAFAHVCCELGRSEEVASLGDEFVSALREGRSISNAVSSLPLFSWALAALGRGGELADALEPMTGPWARASSAFAKGDPLDAAEIFAEMGALNNEAFSRLAAARSLVAAGRRAEADEQLRRALDFYRSVGARRYMRESESLLAASA
jgi:tetratricopeptide (TPR) repeat protein